MKRILTIDIEYDFETEKTENVERVIPRLLSYFHDQKIHATFFVVGKIAEKYPTLLKEIAKEHEVASHSFEHVPLSRLSPEKQEEQLLKGKRAIEKLGISCRGIRAPFYMIGKHHFALVKKAGFQYDSSISTFFPGRFLHFPRTKPYKVDGIIELPVPNWISFFPPAGLSYYRFFYPFSRLFPVPYMIYFHPCEFLSSGMSGDITLPVRLVYRRMQGEKAWFLLKQLLSHGEWISCQEYLSGTYSCDYDNRTSHGAQKNAK